MESLTMAAVAIGTVVATKALEKTGAKVGEAVFDQTAKFLESLKQESPGTMIAIEQAPELPLDYGKAVLEIEAAAKVNPQFAQAMQELATTAEAEGNPKLDEVLQEIKDTLNARQASMSKLEKFADKIGQFVQTGSTGKIEHQSF
ncbi:MAG: hypothetical protein GDA56_26790 [Hormoscilla sp. GM7CHS1pb]|nr:hypothetical protein [Hormoscilla sp. GM7CHS1pb]MBC6480847.1 hypothetical protein [Hormoscilla sp. GM7CHS1pb]